MTRAEILAELKGVVPVIIHWDDAWSDTDDDKPGDLDSARTLTIGFLRDPSNPQHGLVVDICIDGTEPTCKIRSRVPDGMLRAVTYLVPVRSVPYKVTAEAGRAIRLDGGKGGKRGNAPKEER